MQPPAPVESQSEFLAPSQQLLTLMFIDIVGFSRSAEKRTPKAVFDSLRSMMDLLTPIIRQHGGIIDKTMGDGVLCLFGYHDGRTLPSVEYHGDLAVKCALAIQVAVLTRNESIDANKEPIHPLRIGIHTESVYIGDMGEPGRVEFTVIGNGVNFTQRLEAACEPYRIQIGSSVREKISIIPPDSPEIHRRLIKIKYHEELIESFELNPFLRTPSRLETAMRVYQESAGLMRTEPRWPVDMTTNLRMKSPIAEGVPINFSLGGMAVQLDKYLGKGVLLSIDLDSTDGRLAGYFLSRALGTITAEVRWGLPLPGGKYLHGLRYLALSQGQREDLLSGLHQTCQISSVLPAATKHRA